LGKIELTDWGPSGKCITLGFYLRVKLGKPFIYVYIVFRQAYLAAILRSGFNIYIGVPAYRHAKS